MNTLQINTALTTDANIQKIALGVFPCDKIPKKCSVSSCFVANTDSSEEKGAHWVCFYTDENGKCTFFDSYGQSPHNNRYFKKFLCTARKYEWNNVRYQGELATCCGQYCILYLYLRSRNHPHSQIVDLFGRNLSENDLFVTKWVNRQFSFDLPVTDVDFAVAQIS